MCPGCLRSGEPREESRPGIKEVHPSTEAAAPAGPEKTGQQGRQAAGKNSRGQASVIIGLLALLAGTWEAEMAYQVFGTYMASYAIGIGAAALVFFAGHAISTWVRRAKSLH